MRCERYRREPNSQVSKIHQVQDSGSLVGSDDDQCRADDRPAVHRRPSSQSESRQFVKRPVGEIGESAKQLLSVLITLATGPRIEAALWISDSPGHADVLCEADWLATAGPLGHVAQLLRSAAILPIRLIG